jgi:hypothetical protein
VATTTVALHIVRKAGGSGTLRRATEITARAGMLDQFGGSDFRFFAAPLAPAARGGGAEPEGASARRRSSNATARLPLLLAGKRRDAREPEARELIGRIDLD